VTKKVKNILKIGIAAILILFSTTSTFTTAEQTDDDDVEVIIKGGIGVTIEVINNRNTTVEVNYTVRDRLRITEGNMTVPPNPDIGFEIRSSTARFSNVWVSASWDNETFTRVGFTFLFFTYLTYSPTL
jgi:hypothetical protein